MKSYNYILLDWDGNLAKTLDIWLKAFRQVVNKRGFKPTDEEIAASFGASIAAMKHWGIEDPEAAMDEADKLAKINLPNVELYPDTLEVLEYLNNLGKKMALITSSTHDNIDHLLEKYNLDDYFLAVIAGDDITHHKPHPEPLEKAMKAIGADKDQAVIIGDSDKDIGAAHNTGIDSILFYPTEHSKFYDLEKLKALKPTHIVEDLRQVKGIIK
jgi:pyrophosphatase PpaX